MQPPQPGEAAALLSPPRALAASKVWLGSIPNLHRQQLKGPLLPRFHRATWQQVAIPETSLSPRLHCSRGWEGCRSPPPSLPGSLLARFAVWMRKGRTRSLLSLPRSSTGQRVGAALCLNNSSVRESEVEHVGYWDGLACVLALACAENSELRPKYAPGTPQPRKHSA